MIERMNRIIHQVYRVQPVLDGNNLILLEESNTTRRNTLVEIRINTRQTHAFAVYKFDQRVKLAEKEGPKTNLKVPRNRVATCVVCPLFWPIKWLITYQFRIWR